MKKSLGILGFAAAFSAAAAMTALAGQWQQDTGRAANTGGISNWWYQNDDGSYPADGWYWLDGNADGVAESYRFDQGGWMYAATQVDGYLVDDNGAWVDNGQIQTKTVEDLAALKASGNTQAAQESGSGEKKNTWYSDQYGKQYYDGKGKPVTGWKKVSGKRYYFDDAGYMVTGLQEVDGSEYYFYTDGQLALKTVHADGVYYVVDKNDHYIVDTVDEEDWKIYRRDADKDSVDVSNITTEDNEKDSNAVNAGGSDLTDEEAYKKIIALKKSYPEGKKWTNSNSYGHGYGCAGFAFLVQDKVFGSSAKRTTYHELDWYNLRVGDHLRIDNSMGGEHSVIVLTIEDDFITVTEGNYNSSIHWGREISMDELEEVFIYQQTCY